MSTRTYGMPRICAWYSIDCTAHSRPGKETEDLKEVKEKAQEENEEEVKKSMILLYCSQRLL